MTASGYEIEPADGRIAPLLEKLELLQETGRYTRLLSDLLAANDRANLKSLVLEATFASHFERANMPLRYEVRQRADDETSVDFVYRTEWDKKLCIEMRLVQQPAARTALFERQLRESAYFGTTLDGSGDRAETLRLQCLVFEKAVNASGQLIKFSANEEDSYNIVAVEVYELHLKMIDEMDCALVAYGDPVVPELARRGLFGLFQEPQTDYPSYIQEAAARYAPFRSSVHAVLFLRKVRPTHPINYDLEYLFTENPGLMTKMERNRVVAEFNRALNVWESVRG